MSQQIVSTWDGVQNTNSWVHDGDVERSAVDIVELASSVAGYSAGAQAAAAAASGYADTASGAVASIGTAATDAVQAVQNEGTAQISALVDAGGVQTGLIGSAGAAQLADIVTSGGIQISSVGSAGAAQITAITSAGGAQVALVSAAGTSATGDLAAVTAAQSAALVSAGGYQSGLIATAGSAQIAAVQAEGGTQIAAVQLAASAQVSSATVAAMSAGAAASTAQGAASAASGYAVSAGSFVSVTSGYATSAGSAASVASGYALTASSYMTSAGGYASAASDSASNAADSATAAQASAESIEASAEQIQTNERNITNIQALLNGTLYREETDSTAAYSKAVPTGALPYASINEIGGRTVVWNQLVNPSTDANMQWQNFSTRENTDGIVKVTVTQETEVSNVANNVYIFRYRSLGGTRLKTQGDVLYVACSIRVSRRYSFYLTPYYMNVGTCDVEPSTNFQTFSFIGTQPSSSSSPDTNSFFINSANTQTVYPGDVFEFKDPIVINLTQMFGPGNEPATVAEFEAMFPSIDPAYNAGELMSAGVTEAVSEGRNYLPLPIDMTPKTQYGVTVTPHADGTWTATGTAMTSGNIVFAIPNFVAPAGYFHIRNNAPNSQIASVLRASNNGEVSIPVMTPANRIAAILDNNVGKTAAFYGCYVVSGNTYNITWQPSIELTDAVTDYTPYRSPVSYPIPSAIQALPGYGWSAGTAYNYIDYARKVYVQRVASANLGDLTWYTYTQNTVSGFYTDGLVGDKALNMNFVCDKYVNAKNGRDSIPDKSCGTWNLGDLRNRIVIRDSSYTDAASFKAAMSGVMLYYELATPIETDISSLLTDNMIEVEAGGTLTFKNQHGDDWRVPVPNEETFLVQATPELPTTDGTYTLQCTVTDGTPSVTWVTA